MPAWIMFVTQRPTVVIADDNPAMLKAVAGCCSPRSPLLPRLRTAYTLTKAIREHRPQLAILDLSMPKMDGFEVARELRKTNSSTKVVFLTFQSGRHIIEQARRSDTDM